MTFSMKSSRRDKGREGTKESRVHGKTLARAVLTSAGGISRKGFDQGPFLYAPRKRGEGRGGRDVALTKRKGE